jgi:putative Holliday junction resolvase
METSSLTFIGLDVGGRRIGVARINSLVRIAEPLEHIDVKSQDFDTSMSKIISEYIPDGIVVGLPRGLDGQETEQTEYSRRFAENLKTTIDIPIYMIDEAGTSKVADDRNVGGKKSRDSLSAAVFLEDFVNANNQNEMRV